MQIILPIYKNTCGIQVLVKGAQAARSVTVVGLLRPAGIFIDGGFAEGLGEELFRCLFDLVSPGLGSAGPLDDPHP